jgi:hypothetical protein
VGHWDFGRCNAQEREVGADAFGQQFWLLHGRELAAAEYLRPALDIEEPLGPIPRRRDYILREDGEASRHPDLHPGWVPRGRGL